MLTIPASRYFYRRHGPVAGIGFPAAYWATIMAAGLFFTKMHMSVGSLLICLSAAALAVGYAVYLAVWRKDLRGTGAPKAPEGPAMRDCPGCGLSVDAKRPECPACGAELPGGESGAE